MKVGAELGLHDLEANRDQVNSWRPGVFHLREAGDTGVAAMSAA